MSRTTANLPEGTKIMADNGQGELEEGSIIDVLDTMYFVQYVSGRENFIYKAQKIAVIMENP
jgi:hypothetical protein